MAARHIDRKKGFPHRFPNSMKDYCVKPLNPWYSLTPRSIEAEFCLPLIETHLSD